MFDTLEILTFVLWTIFIIYATWYFTSAKHYAPLTPYEARLLWKIHKQNIGCYGRKWQLIKRRGNIIGFKCECGYRHIQKRPIVTSTPTLKIQPKTPIYDKLHKP